MKNIFIFPGNIYTLFFKNEYYLNTYNSRISESRCTYWKCLTFPFNINGNMAN